MGNEDFKDNINSKISSFECIITNQVQEMKDTLKNWFIILTILISIIGLFLGFIQIQVYKHGEDIVMLKVKNEFMSVKFSMTIKILNNQIDKIIAIKSESYNMQQLVEKLLFLARSDKKTQKIYKENLQRGTLEIIISITIHPNLFSYAYFLQGNGGVAY